MHLMIRRASPGNHFLRKPIPSVSSGSNSTSHPGISASRSLGLAQQRYAKSHRILANCLGVKDFRRFRNSQTGHGLVGQFWGLDSDRILKLVLREIIPSQNGSPHGVHRMQIQLISGHESKKSLEVSTNTCHSNQSIRRTRMRSRVWGSKKISVGLYVPLLG